MSAWARQDRGGRGGVNESLLGSSGDGPSLSTDSMASGGGSAGGGSSGGGGGSGGGFSRKSTFGWGAMAFTRELTFTRGLTGALGLDFDTDEAWTKQLIDNYIYGEEHGRDGDVPLPAAFAQDAGFWKTMFLSGIVGCLMGLAGTGFMNVVDYVPTLWIDNGGFDQASDLYFNAGKLYWLCVPMGAGMLIGLIRHYSSYPDNLPGLFKEINSHHVEPRWAPLTFLISAISLGGGASLGPEQALGNLGGGIATYLTQVIPAEHLPSADDKNLLVLSGMAGAMGALFPSPMLGVMMIHELGHPPKTYMESIIVMSIGAISAFLVYYALIGYTKVAYFSTSLVTTYEWTFEEWQCGTAVIIGFFSAVVALVTVIFVGATKQVFVRIRMRLEQRLPEQKLLRAVLPTMIGGLAIGAVNYALPLTLGDGTLVIKQLIQYGHNYASTPPTLPFPLPSDTTPPPTLSHLVNHETISTHLIVASAFAKMFVLGVSLNSGFVGGFVFPTILIGVMTGVVCYQLFPYLPLGLCISCFLAAVPAGICPMPFTLACLAIFTQYNGLYQTIPIYIATITSYTLVCGSGIFSAMQRRAMQAQQRQTESEKEAQALAKEEQTFAINAYMGAKGKAGKQVSLPDSP